MKINSSNADIIKFLNNSKLNTPCLVIDLAMVLKSFKVVNEHFSENDIFYAVKANSAPEILQCLKTAGSSFDVSSKKEIELCLSLGISPDRLSYGNTVKKSADITWAYKNGISMFVFDAQEELKKISHCAPGSDVFCRLQVPNQGAHWPLSNKFGCSVDMAKDLLLQANNIGLNPKGLSFHVGSQQTNKQRWNEAIKMCKEVYLCLKKNNIIIEFINMGGGIPINYLGSKINKKSFHREILRYFKQHFNEKQMRAIIEPGRAIVAEAGIIESEVILVSKKSEKEKDRWVYLDIGRFGGLAETEGEAINYEIKTKNKHNKLGPVIIAGPTCDGADILYEKKKYRFPLNVSAGDKVRIFSAGAYTSVYSSNFNGIQSLSEYFINSS